MNSKKKGDVSTTMIAARLLKKGYAVLTPIGDNERYDLVIETNGDFKTIQCKTARYTPSKTGIMFNCRSVYSHRKEKYVIKTYKGEVDFFGVYHPDMDKTYLVPVGLCTDNTQVLVFDPNNKGTLVAEFFEIGNVAERSIAQHC